MREATSSPAPATRPPWRVLRKRAFPEMKQRNFSSVPCSWCRRQEMNSWRKHHRKDGRCPWQQPLWAPTAPIWQMAVNTRAIMERPGKSWLISTGNACISSKRRDPIFLPVKPFPALWKHWRRPTCFRKWKTLPAGFPFPAKMASIPAAMMISATAPRHWTKSPA